MVTTPIPVPISRNILNDTIGRKSACVVCNVNEEKLEPEGNSLATRKFN
jgi:hypothetical protein